MAGYRFNTAPELRVGLGTAREVGAYCAQLGIKRPLLVSDPGLVGVGLVTPVQEAMAAKCEQVGLFSDVTADPAESVVLDGCCERARLTAWLDSAVAVQWMLPKPSP